MAWKPNLQRFDPNYSATEIRVDFGFTCDNGRIGYRGVNLDKGACAGLASDDIVAIAWGLIKPALEAMATAEDALPSALGKEYVEPADVDVAALVTSYSAALEK